MSRLTSRQASLMAGLSLLALFPLSAQAHVIVGDRIFPQTLAIDDPGVGDELSLPQVNITKQTNDATGDAGWAVDTTAEFDRRITDNFGIAIGWGYTDQTSAAGGNNGLDNLDLGAKYVFYKNPDSESILSAGVDWNVASTGGSQTADHFNTITPALFFGQGMGILPDEVEYLKPLAVTGTLGVGLATPGATLGAPNQDQLTYGFTIQYSLPYLQQHVMDIGLPKPFSQVIPLVEFSFNTPVDRFDGGSTITTGSVNPGFVWINEYAQLAFEAIIPVNSESGRAVGAIAEADFYLDDIMPTIFGKPVFSN